MGASERDETARAAWRAAMTPVEVHRLVLVDESGTHTSLARRYAWAPRGQRARAQVPRNHGKNTTLVAALSWRGMQAPWTVEGAMDTDAFVVYVRRVLAPTLQPGQIVVLDNLSVHKVAAIHDAIAARGCAGLRGAARGCELVYLPAYSPDFTPIEPAFSKLKALLRGLAARARRAHPGDLARRLGRGTGGDHPRRCARLVPLRRILLARPGSITSALSDAEWACVQRYFPSVSRRGRPRTHPLRRILDAIFYVLRTGCPWRYLPSNFPAWQTVYYHFRQFRRRNTLHALYTALHRAERERVGRDSDPSAAIMDSQSVKTVEESARIRGYDAHKCIKGRKRHLLVDTLGLPMACYVTPADLSDPQGARRLLGGLAYFVPRLKKIWADAAYRGKDLADWCQQQGGWELEIVEREPGTRGFQVQPRRWVVERCFAWFGRSRRLAKDYERKVQTSETLIELAAIRLLLRRLTGHGTPRSPSTSESPSEHVGKRGPLGRGE